MTLQIPATVAGMDAVHLALSGCWKALAQSDQLGSDWYNECALAVVEIAANIIQHASGITGLLPPIRISMTRYPNRLVIRFVDRGVMFTLSEQFIMPPVEILNSEPGERGRGLALVQATTDRFEYRRTPDGENIWTIEKRFPRA